MDEELKKSMEKLINLIDKKDQYTIAKSVFKLLDYNVEFDENFFPGCMYYESEFSDCFEYVQVSIQDIIYEELEVYNEIIKEKYKDKTKYKDNAFRPDKYIISLKDMLDDIDLINMLEETGIIKYIYTGYQKIIKILRMN